MFNDDLFDKLEAIHDGTEGNSIEQYCLRHDKVFCIWYTARDGRRAYTGRRTFESLKRLFNQINRDISLGLSDVCTKIVFIPTGETLFELQEWM